MGFTKHVVIIIIINVICYDTFFWLTSLPLNNIFLFGWGWFASYVFFLSPHLLMFQYLLFHLLFWFSSPCFAFHNILYFGFRSIVIIFSFPSSSFWLTRCTFYYFGFQLICLLFSCAIFFPYLLSLFLQLT